jgi:hypothetical protein
MGVPAPRRLAEGRGLGVLGLEAFMKIVSSSLLVKFIADRN